MGDAHEFPPGGGPCLVCGEYSVIGQLTRCTGPRHNCEDHDSSLQNDTCPRYVARERFLRAAADFCSRRQRALDEGERWFPLGYLLLKLSDDMQAAWKAWNDLGGNPG